MRILAAACFGLMSACSGGDDMLIQIATPWVYEGDLQLAPPALAPDNKVVVANSGNEGEIVTLEQTNGRTVDAAFDAFPTQFAPVVINDRVYIITTVGRVTAFDYGGNTLATSADSYGRTGPLVRSRQGLALGTTDGRIIQFDTELNVLATSQAGGAVSTAPAVSADGVVYVATDTGRVTGVTADGTLDFSESVLVPASGPSVDDDRIAVGDGSGVSVFSRGGTMEFRVERPARVVGTRFDVDGSLLAWGEDGFVERYDAQGEIVMSFDGGPPIEADVVPLINGQVGVVDRNGKASVVDAAGLVLDTIELGSKPEPQVAIREGGLSYYSLGSKIQAVNFTFVP